MFEKLDEMANKILLIHAYWHYLSKRDMLSILLSKDNSILLMFLTVFPSTLSYFGYPLVKYTVRKTVICHTFFFFFLGYEISSSIPFHAFIVILLFRSSSLHLGFLGIASQGDLKKPRVRFRENLSFEELIFFH